MGRSRVLQWGQSLNAHARGHQRTGQRHYPLGDVRSSSLPFPVALIPYSSLHRYFTELQVALEPIPDAQHTYRVRTWGKVAPRLGLPKTVKLSSASGAPLPNPAYLALHCAICRVLWSSARAEELKAVLEELEEVTLLASDGSSANLINIAIYRSLALEA